MAASSPLGREKRRAPRARHDSALELLDGSGRRVAAVARLVNFSSVGICFASTQSFKDGQKLEARLRLLKEGCLRVTGRIVWVRRKVNHLLYGLEFDTIRRLHA